MSADCLSDEIESYFGDLKAKERRQAAAARLTVTMTDSWSNTIRTFLPELNSKLAVFGIVVRAPQAEQAENGRSGVLKICMTYEKIHKYVPALLFTSDEETLRVWVRTEDQPDAVMMDPSRVGQNQLKMVVVNYVMDVLRKESGVPRRQAAAGRPAGSSRVQTRRLAMHGAIEAGCRQVGGTGATTMHLVSSQE